MAEREPQVVTLTDALSTLAARLKEIESGTALWGPWHYSPEGDVLELIGEDGESDYWVRLADCRTPAGRLDWIAQVAKKQHLDAGTIVAFIRALDDLVGLREDDALADSRPVRQGPLAR